MANIYAFDLVALSSMLFQAICYVLVSVRVKSWFHFASLPLLTNILMNGALPYLGMANLGPGGSLFAFTFCQATYSAMSVATVVGVILPAPRLRCLRFMSRTIEYSPVVPWFLLILSVIVFSPVLIAFRGSLGDPRYIYSQTRIGYGPSYFLSTTLTLLAWGSYLFVKRRWWQTIVFFCLCAGLIYLHGSKGQIVSLCVLHVLYRVYVLGKGIQFMQFIPLMAVGIVILATAIVLFGHNAIDASDVLEWSEGYSSYTSNAMVVIDHPKLFGVPNYGRLSFEDQFYTRIPRVLYPGKPMDYGSLELAKIYYPAAYDAAAGDPAFGIGAQYDDFGVFALPILFFCTLGITWFTIGVIRRTRLSPTPGLFLFLAFLSGIALIPAGLGYLLPESLILGFGINLTFRCWIQLKSLFVARPVRRTHTA